MGQSLPVGFPLLFQGDERAGERIHLILLGVSISFQNAQFTAQVLEKINRAAERGFEFGRIVHSVTSSGGIQDSLISSMTDFSRRGAGKSVSVIRQSIRWKL